jgi:hypothetical protein
MFYIVDQDKVYNAVDGKAVPVNVSAERNQFTGALSSYTIEEAGAPINVPRTNDIATIDEVIARFGCADKAYKFPGAAKVKEKTRVELVAEAEARGIEVSAKATKAEIQKLLDEE